MAKLHTLVDPFTTTVDKTTKWPASSADPVWDSGNGGQCRMPCVSSYATLASGYLSGAGAYDLTGSYLLAKVTPPPVGTTGREMTMEVRDNANDGNKFIFYWQQGNIYIRRYLANAVSGEKIISYSASTAWWRIAESGGTVTLDTSPDGVSWTNQLSTAAGFTITAVRAVFLCGYFGTESASSGYIDSVNTVGTPQTVAVGSTPSAQAFAVSSLVSSHPPQARAVLGQFLVGNEAVGYRIGVPGVWPSPWIPTITAGTLITGSAPAITGVYQVSQFGTLTFKTVYNQTVTVGGVPSAQAFGVPKLALKFGPGSVPSAQAFGSITIKTTVSRSVGSVPSAQAFGVVTPKSVIRISVGGVSSAQAFGTIKTAQGRPVGGVPSAQAFGVPTIKATITVAVGGVPSAQSFGVVTPKASYRLTPAGVPSAQAFGAIVLRTGFTKAVPGLGSAQAFGVVKTSYGVTVPGVPSAQKFSATSFAFRVQVGGVPSAQAFGTPQAYIAWIGDIECADLDLGTIACTDSDLGEIACVEPDLVICGYPSPTVTTPPTICGQHKCGGVSTMWELDCIDTWINAEGGTHGAILNEFRVGDGTLVGQTETTVGPGGGYFLDVMPPPINIDLDLVECV